MTGKATKGSAAPNTGIYSPGKLSSVASFVAAVALVAVTTFLCEQTRPYLSPINMVMAYLLAVVLAALFLGRKPAVLTAFLGVLAFDFYFVPPRFSFSVSDKEYLLTFLALFTVGIVISSLVAKARESLEALRRREAQTETLYQLSRSLAAAANTAEITAAVKKNIESSLGGELAVFLPKDGELVLAAKSASISPRDCALEVAAWSFRSRRWAGCGTESYGTEELVYVPIKALAQTLGVLGVRLDRSENTKSLQTQRLLEAFASLTAIALERGRLMEEAQQAQILTARENLERALLNSISHDLRTPLAAITGALSAVLDEKEKLKEQSRGELLENARVEAERLNRFVGNLLDMTRLEAGALRPRLELCDVQDVIGCALGAIEKRAADAEIEVQIAPDLPLVPMDLALMVQVLVNLLDNALKYAPPEKGLLVASHRDRDNLFIEVADRGPGIPEHDLPRIFEKFFRTAETVGGTGLGLSICKGIVEAHGGSIGAENREGGGLRVVITLPLGEPVAQEGERHDQ